jgi:putative tricarboxylic transport membrane protein
MIFADRIVGFILVLLAATCIAEGIRVWDGFGRTGFMPAIVGLIFVFLSPGLLLRKSRDQEAGIILWPQKGVWQKIGFILASLVLYTLLVPWIGYPLATTLFLTMLLRATGTVRWGYGVVFGVGVSASTYVIFKIWLNMPLPAGFWGI